MNTINPDKESAMGVVIQFPKSVIERSSNLSRIPPTQSRVFASRTRSTAPAPS